ncbi:MAG: prolipoprotein diacylglyceryl transferase [Bacteroidia bacterium]|nr:prolipoprotein diacylglyceryl transferase [Bacteroidia bacterium]
MNFFLYTNWNPSPEIINLGSFALRWYGVLFGMSFVLGYAIIARMFKLEKAPEKWLDPLVIYMAAGTFLGARLGHCFFYEPGYYLEHPLEILMIWKGGLASHGAAVGIILAMFVASRRVTKRSVFWILDRIVVVVALSGLMIRTGNLINSEIIGSETDGSWGIVYQGPNAGDQDAPVFFAEWKNDDIRITYAPENMPKDTLYLHRSAEKEEQGVGVAKIPPASLREMGKVTLRDENVPHQAWWYTLYEGPEKTPVWRIHVVGRHPSQVYEAFAYTLIFVFLLLVYYRQRGRVPYAQHFGLFLILTFTARFIIEFFKEGQVGFEEGMTLNMGQLLSIPFVIGGIFFVIWSRGKGKEMMNREQPETQEA